MSDLCDSGESESILALQQIIDVRDIVLRPHEKRALAYLDTKDLSGLAMMIGGEDLKKSVSSLIDEDWLAVLVLAIGGLRGRGCRVTQSEILRLLGPDLVEEASSGSAVAASSSDG